MGIKNYLIEGVSGTGKTSVCKELIKRNFHAINGDRELAYQGDPRTGIPVNTFSHENHIWDIKKVKSIIADKTNPITFFCGGSRNFNQFIYLFDKVFVLEVEIDTLKSRLDLRPEDEWGGKSVEKEVIFSLHQTKEDIPQNAVIINSNSTITKVVDDILKEIR